MQATSRCLQAPAACFSRRPLQADPQTVSRRGKAAYSDRRAAGGGGRGQPRPRLEEVTLTREGVPLRYKLVTQADLTDILRAQGAVGFKTDDGSVSRRLEALAEGADVELVMPNEVPLAKQVTNLQQADANITRGKEQQLGACLQNLANSETPGCAITALPTTPFKTAKGEDYVQLDAAVVAGHTLFLGEHKRVLGEDGVGALAIKLFKIRGALIEHDESPDLVAALQGVRHVKLFLGGEAVQQGLALQKLVKLAAVANMAIVLPSGQGLEVVGATAAVGL